MNVYPAKSREQIEQQ